MRSPLRQLRAAMNPKSLTAKQLIAHLGLQPLPVEGGYYRQTYRSAETLQRRALPARYRSSKAFGTPIYSLLTAAPESFSALHTRTSEEIFHFHLGGAGQM